MAKPRRRKPVKAKAEPTKLSRRLLALREASELSRAEMAKRLGWSEIRVYRVETGWTRPLASDVQAYAQALTMTVVDVYGRAA